VAGEKEAVVKYEVGPNPTGVIEVEHGLGTMSLDVRCETADGAPVGYLGAVPIDENRVEVAIAPGADVATVHVTRRIDEG
jgi:hypothetical protein